MNCYEEANIAITQNNLELMRNKELTRVVYASYPAEFPRQEHDIVIDTDLCTSNFGSFGAIPARVTGCTDKRLDFYHSFWSRPAIDSVRWGYRHQYYMTLALAGLSVACLKALGQNVHLYTDTLGAILLDCLPYDSINTRMDELKTPLCFFASGKIVAMQLAPEGSVYLDYDVFIHDASIIDKLSENKRFVSHIEDATIYKEEGSMKYSFLEPKLAKLDTSYNMGVVKLDKETIDTFAKRYFNYQKQIIKDEEFLKGLMNNRDARLSPDLIIEQLNLHNLVDCEVLIENPDFEYENSEDYGFTHLLAMDKMHKLGEVMNALKQLNEDIYSAVTERFENLNFQIAHYGDDAPWHKEEG